MPVARSKADIICLAVYALTGGRLMQGRMVKTVSERLGITFHQALNLAEAAAKAGLIHLEHGSSVSLTEKGRLRGATLTSPGTEA
jgi:Mn-dependent DtxR family transcriptional regulator